MRAKLEDKMKVASHLWDHRNQLVAKQSKLQEATLSKKKKVHKQVYVNAAQVREFDKRKAR